jgi:Arc/MetJ-type ribon-helix-helix transcriptional regulator
VTVELKPETERLVQEEIQRGHFRSVDEMIVQGVTAWREKHQADSVKPRKRLYDLLTQPPFAGSDLPIERQTDYPRPVDLS